MKPWLKYGVLGICAWYILLVVVHYLNQRPLWNDELCVLNNILQLKPHELFSRSLISDQAFPRFYLWGIQQFSIAFEYKLWALRFFPLMAMLAAFLLWMRIGCMAWPSNLDRLNFVLCWAASIPLIYYAAELKQYSLDVLSGAILVYLLLRVSQGNLSSRWLCFFPLLGFLSYPVYFLMFVPVYVLWPMKKTGILYCGVCVLMVIYVWCVDLRYSPAYLLETYWHDYFISFVSLPEFFKTLGEGINNLVSRWLVEIPKVFRGIARLFLGVGFAYMLWRGIAGLRQKSSVNVPMVALLVFVELLMLGALRKFPFTVPRMSLFFAPMLIFCLVAALAEIRQHLNKIYWPLQVALWLYLVCMSFGISRVIFNGDLGAQSAIF